MAKRSSSRAGFASPQPQRQPPTPTLREIQANSPEWTAETTTCLSLGLDPANSDHRAVTCDGCAEYWQKKLKFNIQNSSVEPRSRRTSCERTFSCDNNAKPYRCRMRDRIKGMFVVQEASCESHKSGEATHTAIPLSSWSGARPRMRLVVLAKRH